MLRYPAALSYPIGFLLSPLFVPAVRQAFLKWVPKVGRQKYVARLLLGQLTAWHHRLRLSSHGVPSEVS